MKPSNSRHSDRYAAGLDRPFDSLGDGRAVAHTPALIIEGIADEGAFSVSASSGPASSGALSKMPPEAPLDPLIGLPDPFKTPDDFPHYRPLRLPPASAQKSPEQGVAQTTSRPKSVPPSLDTQSLDTQSSEGASHHSQPRHSQSNRSQFNDQSNGQSNVRFTQSRCIQSPGGQPMSSSLVLSSDAWPSGPVTAEPMTEVIDIYLQQAEAYCEEKQWEKAFNACQEILKVAPTNALAYKFLGKILQQQGRTTDAMGFYAKALTLQPNFPEVYSNLGSLHAKKGQWETAVDYYKKAIEKDPTFAVAYFNLAKVWKRLGHKDSEMNCLATAFRLQPDLGSAKDYYRLGQALESAQNPEAALDFYQRATERSADMVEAYQRIADLLENKGDWQGAAVCYRKVLALSTAAKQESAAVEKEQLAAAETDLSSNGLNSNGLSSNGLSPHDLSSNGIGQLRALPQASPQLPSSQVSSSQPLSQAAPPSGDLLTQQAQRYAQAQDWKNAIECIRQAIKQAPRSAPLYRNLAKLLERSNASQSAAEAWYRSFVLEPSWPSVEQLVSLGNVLGRAGNVAAATNCFNQSIKAQPSFAPAYEALARLLQSQGNVTAAEAVLKQQPLTASNGTQSIGAGISSFQPQPPLRSESQVEPQFQRITESPPGSSPLLSQQTLTSAELKAKSQAIHQRGDALQAQGRLREALECYQQAVKLLQSDTLADPSLNSSLSPSLSSAIVEAQSRSLNAHKQGDAMRERGKFSEAIAYYQEAIRLNSSFSWSHHSLGDCYKQLSDYANAVSAYRQAIALNDDFIWSHYSLGEVLAAQGQWSEAAEAYRRVIALEPGNAQVPAQLASVLHHLIARSPREVSLYQELATQLLADEKPEEAIALYQLAVQIHPGDTELISVLVDVLAESDPQQAQQLAARARCKVLTSEDIQALQDLADPLRVAMLLKHTHLFDAVYYRATNPAVAQLDDWALLKHYIAEGSAVGRNPNPLFDDAFYRSTHPEIVEAGINPLAHYHCFGHPRGADPHPCFSVSFYRERHEDVAAANVDPLDHYLGCGARAGRVAFSADQFSHLLHHAAPEFADCLRPWQQATEQAVEETRANQTNQSIGVYCNTMGNYFIAEIADFVAAALTAAGHNVIRLSEQDVPPVLDSHWVIAPHEFFYLGEGMHWAKRGEWLDQAVMINVEQPQTTWFSKAFHFLRHAKIIFDINVKSAAIMQTLGLPAYWLPLGTLPDYAPFTADAQLPDLLPMRSLPAQVKHQLPAIDAPLHSRPLDIHFVGTLNQRREVFFAQSAQWLSQYRCFFHMPPMGLPLIEGQDQALDTAAVIGLSRRSKILLNVHRDPLPYFEWHRLVFHGLWQNTLVVTETCHDIPGLVAGEHFVVCSLREMADKIDWLLRSPEGQIEGERIRQAGHKALKEKFDGTAVMAKALQMATLACVSEVGDLAQLEGEMLERRQYAEIASA